MSTDRPVLRLHDDVRASHVTRLREGHVARLLELAASRHPGAVLLDLALRAAALLPDHLNNRDADPGIVIGAWMYEDLFDVVRGDDCLGIEPPAIELRKRREWVRRQLRTLEGHQLVRRDTGDTAYGNRPRLYVRRDDGSGLPFDDPGDTPGQRWIAIPNAPFAAGHVRSWGTPEVTGFLAAMIGERYERYPDNTDVGDRRWNRSHEWFLDPSRPPKNHTTAWPIGRTTFYKGLDGLAQRGLVVIERKARNPVTGRRFSNGPRNVYTNQFVTASSPLIAALDTIDTTTDSTTDSTAQAPS